MDATDRTRAVAWAREMRVVHDRLREAVELAREGAELDLPPPAPGDDRLLYCWGFCLALTGHHRGEDRVLFPALQAEHPDLADTLAGLRRDHHMLDHLLGAYRRALDAGTESATLVRHLEGISAVMETHFRFEERRLLPLLDGLALPAAPTEALGPLAGGVAGPA